MELCPINFWVKVSLHLERNCSVNNVLMFAAVKGAFRKQPHIPVNTALGFFYSNILSGQKTSFEWQSF